MSTIVKRQKDNKELVELTVYSPFNDKTSCHYWYDSLETVVDVWGEQHTVFYKFNIWVVNAEEVLIPEEPQISG